MNEFFTQLKKEALETRLSPAEKQRMRFAVHDAMQRPPAPQPALARPMPSSYFMWFSFVSSRSFALPVVVLLIVALGGGTAFAAQGSLPGDTLYAIKVNVTEPALGALAVSDEAKAQWNAQVAQTRLEEAESLTASGTLNASTSAELSKNFEEHSNAAQALAQKVEDEDPGTGAELAAEFGSSLEAHDAILSRLAATSSSGEFAGEVIVHVRQHGTQTLALATSDLASDTGSGSVNVRTFAALAPQTDASNASTTEGTAPAPQTAAQVKVSLKLQKAAAAALADAQGAFDSAKGSLDASSTARINAELTRIGVVVNAATSTQSLTRALKDATVLEAFLKASKTLNRNFFNTDDRFKIDARDENGSDMQGAGQSLQASSSLSAGAQVIAPWQTQKGSGGASNSGYHPDGEGGQPQNDQNQGEDDQFVNHLLNKF